MRRVLFVTNSWPDDPESPRGWFVRDLALRLYRLGVGVDVVTERVFSHSPATEQANHGLVRRFTNPLARGRLLAESRGVPLARVGWLLGAGTVAGLTLARRSGCHLIHAHWAVPAGVYAALLAGLTGRPLVVSVHGSDLTRFGPDSPAGRLAAAALRRAALVIANSSFTARLLLQRGVEPERLRVAPACGVDTERFLPGPDRAGRRRLLSVGALLPQKRPEALLEAFARAGIPDTWRLRFVGDGPLRAALERQAVALGVTGRVEFAGSLPAERMPDEYRAASLFALASRGEGLGLAALEAMASGLPVVASDDGGLVDLVDDGRTGLLVGPDDADGLAAAIGRLAGDVGLADRMGVAAREVATRRFAAPEAAAAHLGFYLSVLEGRS